MLNLKFIGFNNQQNLETQIECLIMAIVSIKVNVLIRILIFFYYSVMLRFSKDNIYDFIFGSLVFLIISLDPQLIFDPKNIHLCNNFCQESHFVTIMKSF
jgi:hypothetical protein